jgi:hypothetical protein
MGRLQPGILQESATKRSLEMNHHQISSTTHNDLVRDLVRDFLAESPRRIHNHPDAELLPVRRTCDGQKCCREPEGKGLLNV